MNHRLFQIASLLIVLFSGAQKCEFGTVGFDYQTKPSIPFAFEHLDLDLTILPSDNVVKGIATYAIRAKAPSRFSLLLHAAELEIDGVTMNDEEVEFKVSNDSLLISLSDTLEVGERAKIAVTWQAKSVFGTHLDYLGTVWGSLNPKALRHWLPIFDHPRVESKIDAKFTIPANLEVVFNGNLLKDEIVSADQKTIYWSSKTAIPVTGMSFAVGSFKHDEVIAGTKKVRLYSEKSILTTDEFNSLLQTAIATKKSVENTLSFEFPFDALNIVVLQNSYWEEKQSGAGIIYLYKDLGSLSAQLKRGIYSQWFGHYQRSENMVTDLEKMEVMRTALHYSIEKKPIVLENPDSLYSALFWNAAQEGFKITDNFFQQMVKKSLAELIKSGNGVVNNDKYDAYWYEQTGLNWASSTTSLIDDLEGEQSEKEEPLLYSVNATYDERNSKLTFYFEALSGNGEILSGLNLNVYTFDDTTSSEIAFTGQKDSVTVEVPMSTEYITLSSGVTKLDQIEYGSFPVILLLNQLRSTDVNERALAARLLRYHTDNPDLQLALGDALSSETNPEVKANLLETFGVFTKGATGTEQTFLKELNSKSESIQLAAVKTLGNYFGDDVVSSSLQSKILRTEYPSVFSEALLSYQTIAPTTELFALATRLQKTDITGQKTLDALQLVMDVDSSKSGIGLLEELVNTSYPYSTRSKALELLLQFQNDEEYWRVKTFELADDLDPRIRIQALESCKYLYGQTASELLSKALVKEFDPRVRQAIEDWSEIYSSETE